LLPRAREDLLFNELNSLVTQTNQKSEVASEFSKPV